MRREPKMGPHFSAVPETAGRYLEPWVYRDHMPASLLLTGQPQTRCIAVSLSSSAAPFGLRVGHPPVRLRDPHLGMAGIIACWPISRGAGLQLCSAAGGRR